MLYDEVLLFFDFDSLTNSSLWSHWALIKPLFGHVVHTGKLGWDPGFVEVFRASFWRQAPGSLPLIRAHGHDLLLRVLSVSMLLPRSRLGIINKITEKLLAVQVLPGAASCERRDFNPRASRSGLVLGILEERR